MSCCPSKRGRCRSVGQRRDEASLIAGDGPMAEPAAPHDHGRSRRRVHPQAHRRDAAGFRARDAGVHQERGKHAVSRRGSGENISFRQMWRHRTPRWHSPHDCPPALNGA